MGGRGRTRECGSRGISLILMRHMLRDRVYKRPELRLSNLRGDKGVATVCIYTNGSCAQTMFGSAWLVLHTNHQTLWNIKEPYPVTLCSILTNLIGILTRSRVGQSSLDPTCPFCHWLIRSA